MRTGRLALIVFFLALVPRVWGFDWQLPEALYYDELKYVLWAERTEATDGEELDFRNPTLFGRLLGLEYRALGALGWEDGARLDGERARRWLSLRLASARLTVAALGAASVAVLFLAAASLWGVWVAAVAASLYGLSFLSVHLAHLALNDVPASFFLAAALWAAARALARPTAGWLGLSGLAAGLATATKYNFAIALAAPVVAIAIAFLRARVLEPVSMSPSPPPFRRKLSGESSGLLSAAAACALAAAAGLVVGMPEVVAMPQEVAAGIARQMEIGSQPWNGQEPSPVAVLYFETLVQSGSLAALALAGAGGVAFARRHQAAAAVLLAPPGLYLAGMLGKPLFFARFALPLVPFVCLLAAYGLDALARGLPRAVLRRAVATALVLAALLPPSVLIGRHNLLLGQKDTRLLAQEWIQSNLPPEARVAAQTYSVPIRIAGISRSYDLRLHGFRSLSEPGSLLRLACDGYRYVLVSSFQYERHLALRPPGGRPTGYELLARDGRLLQSFAAGRVADSVPFHVDDTAIPFWYLERERPGPTIKIYELPSASVACAGR